ADGGIRTVASAFEISDQCCEPSAEQTRAACGLVEGSVVDLFALATPVRVGAKTNDRDHFGRQRQFDLLDNFGWQFAGHDRSVAIGTFGAVKFGVVDLIIGKEGPLVPRMSGLAAPLAFLAVLGLIFWFLDDVAGRGFRRVAG